MVVVTAAAGFLLAGPPAGLSRSTGWVLLVSTLAGTGLLAAGSAALNQLFERETDSRMRRTANRPLPTGRIGPEAALAFAFGLVLLGLVVLLALTNLLTASLGALTVAGYVFVYTPMKRLTSLATVVGAVPGALPPMMGWAAARGELGLGAWALFGLLFFWQMPHFLAIAWMYREDYAQGGFPMLTVRDPEGRATALQMILWGAALVPVSLLPSVLGMTDRVYFFGALALGIAYLLPCLRFARAISKAAARQILLVSVLYLPAILLLTLLDRWLRL